MTNPSDPGHPPRPPAPGGPGDPYGTPPPPSQQRQTGPIPVPRPPDPSHGPQDQGYGQHTQGYGQQEQGHHQGYPPQDQRYASHAPQQGWAPPPRDPAGRGVVGSLFDLNFDSMVTPKVTKMIYALAMVPISLIFLLMVGYGLQWLAEDATFLGLTLLIAAPFTWLFQMLATRVLMEFVINQFKITEYLRAIKDKD